MMRSIYGLKRGWWGSGLVALARLKSEQSHFVSPFHYIYIYIFSIMVAIFYLFSVTNCNPSHTQIIPCCHEVICL
jgi:hypothetical protein